MSFDPSNPPPTDPNSPFGSGSALAQLEAKIASIMRGAIGETTMGPGYYLDDGNGVHAEPNWCEAAAETGAAMATGIRIRFPSAKVHYQTLLAQGEIHTDEDPPEGTFVFYDWANDPNDHITVSSGNRMTIGTVIVPAKIEELPLHYYTGYAGWAHAEAAIRAAQRMQDQPADPNGGGLGIVDPTKTYRVFNWLKDSAGQTLVVGNAIRNFWDETGPQRGIIFYGYPIDNEHQETNDKGVTLTVQNFERNRLEFHPENQDPYRVLLGRIGAEMLDWWVTKRDPALAQHRVSPTTDLIDPSFAPYWMSHGGLPVYGLPLTGLVTLPDSTYVSQVFERAVLEQHPESADWPVQVRRLGVEAVALQSEGMKISG